MQTTKVFVLTTAKDEGWMIERFLATCSQFADHIFISDESSGLDNSLDIYKKYPKVILYHNGESHVEISIRRQFLLNEARKVECNKRVIIAIDSDEVISANVLDSPEWSTILNAEPSTLFHLQWVTLWHNKYWLRTDNPLFYGIYNRQIWIDDGKSNIPSVGSHGMHIAYNPMNAKKNVYLNDIVCLHYQCCNWQRMEAKHRFYRAKEKSIIKQLSDLAIYRIYGHIYSKNFIFKETLNSWFYNWEKLGIDMSSIEIEPITHFDIDVIHMFQKRGTNFFVKQDVWKTNWNNLYDLAKNKNVIPNNFKFIPPKKNLFYKIYHKYMAITIDNKFIRFIERLLFHKSFLYRKKNSEN